MDISIIGTGSALPKLEMSNDDLAKLVETSDEWIVSRTGIKTRRIISDDEDLKSLAIKSSLEALEEAKIDAGALDLIIVATSTPDNHFPSCACEVQKAIGAYRAACFDISAACSGFLYALHIAENMMKASGYEKVLIIGGDVLSRLVDWQDRGTCILFGDAAGAAVLAGSEDGFLTSYIASDGRGGEHLTCKQFTDDRYIRMNGQEVFKFAVRTVPESIEHILQTAGISRDEIGAYILHQANYRIIESVAKRLNEPVDKFKMNLESLGNTSAASIPVLLDELRKKNEIKKGELIVMAGFGAGLTWGSAIIKI